MDKREAVGSWLSGPREAAEQMGADLGYRGERLGLPEHGPGSIARPGRRIAALCVDWALCMVIAYGLITHHYGQAASDWAVLILGLVDVLLLSTVGTTPGKRLLGLKVVRAGGGRAGFGAVVVRTVLLLVVIPAVVWDRDGRGLHDKAARTVEVRL